MQITVTNQKTKPIRSACSLAECGSHGITQATAPAAAPNTIPRITSWTIDPLRTGAETTRPGGGPRGKGTRLETPATSGVQRGRKRVDGGRTPQGGLMGLGVSILLIAAGAILAFA